MRPARFHHKVALADLKAAPASHDLLVANESGSLGLLANNGNGTFGAQNARAIGFDPFWVAFGDLDGDAAPDLVIANANANSVMVMTLLDPSPTTPAPSPVSYTTGTTPELVVLADVNGDGKQDLIVANVNASAVSVLLNSGSGTFAPQTPYDTGTTPFGIAVADFDGDGKPDLAVANIHSNTVSVLLDTGDGTFGAQTTYPTGKAPNMVAAADFDGDGRPDLAVANAGDGTVSIMLSRCGP